MLKEIIDLNFLFLISFSKVFNNFRHIFPHFAHHGTEIILIIAVIYILNGWHTQHKILRPHFTSNPLNVIIVV